MSVDAQHQNQQEHWTRAGSDPTRQMLHESWFRTDTIDAWRHARMYEPVRAFAHNPELSWITLGDGRFGLDSLRIRDLGFESALPTDIGGALLEQARNRGLIEKYAVENAERLSFADESFDLAFCKESYHHFPRGPLAVHEMLRVARQAAILVEPRDYTIDRPPSPSIGPRGLIRGFAKWLGLRSHLRNSKPPLKDLYQTGDEPLYEESGNYAYTISSREMEKTALGLNLPVLALKGLNDHYEVGFENEKATKDSRSFLELQARIARSDQTSRAGLSSTSMLMAILFKVEPDVATRSFLDRHDWLVLDLPRNPHL